MIFIDDKKLDLLKVAVSNNINMLFVGATGTGKTKIAKKLANDLGKNFFSISVNTSHNFRSTFFGQFVAKNGTTEFIKSKFIEYITIPNSIILLDEINRGVSQSIDSLFTITDPSQRFIDISEINERIYLAKDNMFIATANIGGGYNTVDLGLAAKNRFLTFEFDYLPIEDEIKLIYDTYPNLKTKSDVIDDLLVFTNRVRQKYLSGALENSISTRYIIDYICVLLNGNCDLDSILEYVIYPAFNNDGGFESSERAVVIKIAQSVFGARNSKNTPSDTTNLFFDI